MFVTNWISTTKIQKISEITNFFRHYFLSRTEVFNNFFYTFFVCHNYEVYNSAPASLWMQMTSLGLTISITFLMHSFEACPEV